MVTRTPFGFFWITLVKYGFDNKKYFVKNSLGLLESSLSTAMVPHGLTRPLQNFAQNRVNFKLNEFWYV